MHHLPYLKHIEKHWKNLKENNKNSGWKAIITHQLQIEIKNNCGILKIPHFSISCIT